ncbi:hypothetical protein SDC9_209200 [bioreactor metagenome]|uniref:Uncharacterized protein n=1 Tax=bioreactor metagenome TaxID=1076179 RepID=A0A645JPF2_9ZZZZ
MVAGGIFRLVRSLLLLVHNDKPDVFKRREHCAARAKHDLYLASADTLPLVVALGHP